MISGELQYDIFDLPGLLYQLTWHNNKVDDEVVVKTLLYAPLDCLVLAW